MRHLDGLSREEVSKKIATEGYNELKKEKKKNFLRILLDILREPMFLLLIACGVIYLLLGNVEDALLLLVFVFIVIGITVYQENKTEKALDALRDLSSPRAFVVRDGETIRIAGREVVTGDIIILSEGDRVPADAAIIDCSNLTIDESLLTGESVHVRKTAAPDLSAEIGQPGGEDLPFVYSGTMVVSGQALAVVKKTGMNTEIGKIGKSLSQVKEEKTNLQKETESIVKSVALIALSVCIVVVLIYGSMQGEWLEAFLSGITLAMALLPEEFPVVLTVFLALGAWRMSGKKVLVRRQRAIQALGSATVLCSDKTGTMTQNTMTIKKIYSGKKIYSLADHPNLDEAVHEVVEYGILASQKEPLDPMEKALKKTGYEKLTDTEHLHENWDMVKAYPISDQLLAVCHLWKSPGGSDYVVAAKGAPEAIIDLCHLEEHEDIDDAVEKMSGEGLRVIAVARSSGDIKENQHDFPFEFLGLIGYEDPIRPDLPDAIQECYSAGIRVIMITGDYPGTASNIARQIGLQNAEDTITGSDLEQYDEAKLRKKIGAVNVFARVVPQQKLRIVNALKENGEIVAMTGDGVNDAPALKTANIGVAMGAKGTDVARESSSIVLLDDNFSSIVKGVRMGRRIFDNIRNAMAYVLAVHIPIAGITMISVFAGWPIVLLPVHIMMLELIIDPACSVIFEAEEEKHDIMLKPPRDPKERILNKKTVLISIFQGAVILLIVSMLFFLSYRVSNNELEARALTVNALVLFSILLIILNKAGSSMLLVSLRQKNTRLWPIAGGSLFFLIVIQLVPYLREMFKFGQLHYHDFVYLIGSLVLVTAVIELVKLAYLMMKKRKTPPALT